MKSRLHHPCLLICEQQQQNSTETRQGQDEESIPTSSNLIEAQVVDDSADSGLEERLRRELAREFLNAASAVVVQQDQNADPSAPRRQFARTTMGRVAIGFAALLVVVGIAVGATCGLGYCSPDATTSNSSSDATTERVSEPTADPAKAPSAATRSPIPAPTTNPTPPNPSSTPAPSPSPTTTPPTAGPPCGSGNVGNGDCADRSMCCSEWGWCGTSAEYCSRTPCGNGYVGNGDCADRSMCCSEWGYCGTSAEYCKVDPSPSPITPTPPPVSGGGSPQCPPNGYVLIPSAKCEGFYHCMNGAIMGDMVLCPTGTLFNKDVSVCDWPSNVNC